MRAPCAAPLAPAAAPLRRNGARQCVSSSENDQKRRSLQWASKGVTLAQRRSGQWTGEEERYALKVSDLFKAGTVPNTPDGVTLRAL